MKYIRKAIQAVKDGGLRLLIKRTIRWVYPKFRKLLDIESRIYEYNGIPSRAPDYHWLDSYIPFYEPMWYLNDIPGYEAELIESIERYVEDGDSVTVVGGGFGVTSVCAAHGAGPQGDVCVFEGAASCVDRIRETTRLNHVDTQVSIKHAVVGSAIDLRDSPGDANVIHPSELPECDVLELDCEGAELEILQKLEIRPRDIIVETHGVFGSPTDKVITALNEIDYEVVDRLEMKPDQGVDIIVASYDTKTEL